MTRTSSGCTGSWAAAARANAARTSASFVPFEISLLPSGAGKFIRSLALLNAAPRDRVPRGRKRQQGGGRRAGSRNAARPPCPPGARGPRPPPPPPPHPPPRPREAGGDASPPRGERLALGLHGAHQR